MPTISKGLKQAYDLQDLTFAVAKKMGEALSLSEKFSREDASVLAQVVRAWEACQERVRIQRGKPLPGSRRPAPEAELPPKSRRFKNRPPEFGTPQSAMPSAGSAAPAG